MPDEILQPLSRGEDAQGKIWVGGAYRYLRSNQRNSLKPRLDLLQLDLMSYVFYKFTRKQLKPNVDLYCENAQMGYSSSLHP